jgi:hypothetical protein
VCCERTITDTLSSDNRLHCLWASYTHFQFCIFGHTSHSQQTQICLWQAKSKVKVILCALFYDDVIIKDHHGPSNGGMIAKWWIGKVLNEVVVACLRYSLDIFLKRIKIINLSHNIQCTNKYSNQSPPKYESEALLLLLSRFRSVWL